MRSDSGGPGWAAGWGSQDDEESVGAIKRTLELGVNWIDTAAVYGLGHSEEVVARVLEAVRTLRAEDFAAFGRLMYDSHLSLRDDFEVSTLELNTFVGTARSRRSGSQLTGAGFGGCAVDVIAAAEIVALSDSAQDRFRVRGFEEPAFYKFQPSAGAEVTD